jgi:hypothetical protein
MPLSFLASLWDQTHKFCDIWKISENHIIHFKSVQKIQLTLSWKIPGNSSILPMAHPWIRKDQLGTDQWLSILGMIQLFMGDLAFPALKGWLKVVDHREVFQEGHLLVWLWILADATPPIWYTSLYQWTHLVPHTSYSPSSAFVSLYYNLDDCLHYHALNLQRPYFLWSEFRSY